MCLSLSINIYIRFVVIFVLFFHSFDVHFTFLLLVAHSTAASKLQTLYSVPAIKLNIGPGSIAVQRRENKKQKTVAKVCTSVAFINGLRSITERQNNANTQSLSAYDQQYTHTIIKQKTRRQWTWKLDEK